MSDHAFTSTEESDTTPPPTEIEPPMYDPLLHGKLLRLRKAVGWVTSQGQSYSDFREIFCKLIDPSHLVSYHLVHLPDGLIALCNEQLRLDERHGKRKGQRRGTYLKGDEPYGMLVRDMTSGLSDEEILIEFKPKWLAQSPTAPKGAKRCRTCALEARKRAQQKDTRPAQDVSWCPLALIGANKETRSATNRLMLRYCAKAEDKPLRTQLERFFLGDNGKLRNPLLNQLKDLQMSGDPFGILDEERTDPFSNDFLVTMTLRDCTLFLRVSPLGVEARLGDLDMKMPVAGKLRYWRSLEEALIQEGWYTEEEAMKQWNGCILGSG